MYATANRSFHRSRFRVPDAGLLALGCDLTAFLAKAEPVRTALLQLQDEPSVGSNGLQLERRWDTLDLRTDRLMRLARELRATSLEGLIVKSRISRWARQRDPRFDYSLYAKMLDKEILEDLIAISS